MSKPGTKSEILELSQTIQNSLDRLMEIAEENPTLMVYDKSNGFGESFKAFMEQFEARIGFGRRQIAKYADLMPKRGRKKSK